ncbi:hypothetical protein LX15_001675 [Streptoalloteichus tenebrarius]|uniref:PPE family domain-containing protein n=1 Tax=Streptoalloteichus tenebrarius (strain ATCC 17920 / DSM 40477 / JCM 4838 / CBS 697.72 / NBRC 16177 / NCIMB 11028 / NRRL B-12390 / A12253. 1 / ISP 5477) TaxID=1933 RepID=A0ABT1HR54_STRSD|nr:hypothetical protein [Streptoalloteichus tenebrarius]MCP2257988.1 hypothetical protein [Streptoalloteichus tenebrarius]BFF01655.1 hypothetical protein GCM10020241_33300 [Streptoalloteichus tenebrarius]
MGDLGLNKTNVNWQAKQLDDLYRVKDGEATFEDKVQDWKGVAAEFEAIGQYIDTSLRQARVVQEGAAADAQQQAMQPLAQYADACKGYAEMTANAVQEQGGHRVTAMVSLPEKMDKPKLNWYEAITLPGLVNHELEKAQYDERTEQARKVMQTYETSTNANLSSMPTFEPPPPMAFSVEVPSGGQTPAWNGDYGTGTSVGGAGSTGGSGGSAVAPPPAVVNPNFTSPSTVPNGGGGGGWTPPNHTNPLPTPKPTPTPMPFPPPAGGPRPGPAPTPRPNPGPRPTPMPGRPTGPGTGAGRNTGPGGRVNPGGRALFGPGGGPGAPSGPGGPGGRAGFGPGGGGVGGRGFGPGGFGPMGGGADMGSRSGLGPGGTSGVGAFGPEENGRQGASAGRPGASGPAGAAGAHGARGQGGEDKEHKRPNYLVEMEDIYDDGTKVAPPVIGG